MYMETSYDELSGQPTLPLEVLSHILDIVLDIDRGQRKSDMPLTKEQFTAIRLCSLVCKEFASLTRPHLFRFVDIWFDGGNKLIGQFVQLLEKYPDLKVHVRGLCFSTAYLQEEFATEADVEKYREALLHLPYLESITVRYNPRPLDLLQQPTSLPPRDIHAFTDQIIKHYLLKGMLQIFSAARIDTLPLSALTSGLSLHTLRLHRFSDTLALEKCNLSHSIRALCLSKMHVPISIFYNFPNLEKLQISYASFTGNDTNPSPEPLTALLGLKVLDIEIDHEDLGHELRRFLNFMRECASIHQVKPFKTLQKFRLQLDYPDQRDMSVISSLLEDLESLHTLIINARMPWGYNGAQWSLIRDLNIDGNMKNSLKRLRSLCVKISSPPRSSSYQLPKNDLSDLLLSIPPINQLEDITLDIPIDIMMEPEEDLDRKPWPCLVKILTASSHFPRLRYFQLAFDFRFVIPGVSSLELPDSLDPASHWIVIPCLNAMRGAIKELGRRSNLTLTPVFGPHLPSPYCLRFRCSITVPKLGSNSSGS